MDFWFFGSLSILVTAVTTVLVLFVSPLLKFILKSLNCLEDAKKLQQKLQEMIFPGLNLRLSRLHLMTAGIYIAVLLLFLPYCYNLTNFWGDDHLYIRPALMALFKTFRVFVFGVGFDDFVEIVPSAPSVLRAIFSLYTIALYFLAPLLTVGNVLSLFRDLQSRIYLRLFCRKNVFVLSELNDHAMALAESIAKDKKNDGARIVFCGVTKQQRELLREKWIDAICLKKDVCDIRFRKKGGLLRFFLISDNATRNTTQAVRLNELQKKSKRKTSVYVFSADPATDYILDTLDLGENLLSPTFDQVAKVPAGGALRLPDSEEEYGKMLGNFSIRRIDPVQNLIWDVLKGNNYADYISIQKTVNECKTAPKVLSLSILGMGNHGTQLLKTAVWFYQRKGVRVEVNVFDMGGANGDAQKRLKQECPELVEERPKDEDTEDNGCYDIKFFSTNCFSSDFDALLQNDYSRMTRTNLIFIGLGDDDANIRAAKTMQMVFARITKKESTPMPFVYAVVHNKEKATTMNAAQFDEKGNPISTLRFVGAHSSCYSYEKLKEADTLEKRAFKFHVEWAVKENQLRHCYEDGSQEVSERDDHKLCKDFRRDVFAEYGNNPTDWGDADYYDGEKEAPIYDGPVKTDTLKKKVAQYICSSYCRDSSLAKALHKEALRRCGIKTVCELNSPVCTCDDCTSSRITEHMRWNAYMRALGYRKTDGEPDKTAKLHNNLRPWSNLPVRVRFKD